MSEPMGDLPIRDLVRSAIRQVWEDYPDLVLDQVHERTVVAHIASALNQRLAELPGLWRADVEYDRIWRHGCGVVQKRLWRLREDGDDLRVVIPDLIVHDPRGRSSPRNLLVLEAKRGRVTTRHREHDYIKLGCFMEQLGYRNAVFLEFDGVGGRPSVEWIHSSSEYPDPSTRASEEL